ARHGAGQRLYRAERSRLAGTIVPHAVGRTERRRFDGQDGPRLYPCSAARHASGRWLGLGDRSTGDVADQYAHDSRRDLVPAIATGRTAPLTRSRPRLTDELAGLAKGLAMYKLMLCWRYLRTRFIALASIVSVTLGVATMIVVNSVMEGFTHEMQNRIH